MLRLRVCILNLNYFPHSNFRKSKKSDKILFTLMNPEEPFIGRLKERQELEDFMLKAIDSSTANRIVISGMCGIGKTQFVRQFCHLHQSWFKNVVWINSESSDSIHESFKRLAEDRLKISLTNGDEGKISFDSMIELVYMKLSKTKTLLVYDNVTNVESLKVLINTQPLPFIIITTCIRNWSEANVIRLNTWTTKDAMEYVSEKLQNEEDSEECKKLLVNKFQGFPLALKQATEHIKTNDLRIIDYIQSYDSRKMLDSKFFQETGCLYEETTFTTWNRPIDAVKREASVGELAIKILCIIAYFSPHKIHTSIFVHLMYHKNDWLGKITNLLEHLELFAGQAASEGNVQSAVRLLVNRSLIDGNRDKSELSVHVLVQEVMKTRLQEANRERLTLHYAIMLMSKLIGNVALHLWHSHAVAMSACLIKFRHLMEEFKTHVTYNVVSSRECIDEFIKMRPFRSRLFANLEV